MRVIAVCLLGGALVAGCGKAPTPPPPEKLSTTYRIMAGVSMGGTGAAALGLLKPERFDGVAALGAPLDAHFFLGKMVDKSMMGGFCTLPELEAILAQDPVKLNDPRVIDACMHRSPPAKWEHPQDYNHWRISSNGGTLDRESHLNMMADLMLAHGSFFFENPASPVAPPGIDPELNRHPPANFCTNPVVLKSFYNAEYNPEGKHDVITYCDGDAQIYYCSQTMEQVDFCSDPANIANPLAASAELAFANAFCTGKGSPVAANKRDTPLYWLDHAGVVDACRLATMPLGGTLAVDLNKNRRRDYGEPLINNGPERYDDVGADGCPDSKEDGAGGCTATGNTAADPNHDNDDAESNALGTESNWAWDQGEPFRDFGLDGVLGTNDHGEGNGRFDMSSGRTRLDVAGLALLANAVVFSLLAGFASLCVGFIHLGWKGIPREGDLQPSRLRFGAIAVAVGLVAWALALWNA